MKKTKCCEYSPKSLFIFCLCQESSANSLHKTQILPLTIFLLTSRQLAYSKLNEMFYKLNIRNLLRFGKTSDSERERCRGGNALSVGLPARLPICLSVCLPVCLSVSLSFCLLSTCLHLCLSFCLTVCLSLSVCCLSVCIYAYLSVCLSVCLVFWSV
jgi:hypothetical protein